MTETDILNRIVARKRDIVAQRRRVTDIAEVQTKAGDACPTQGFITRLRRDANSGVAVIAEVKKASPSKGIIREDFDPAAIATAYAKSGASCLSVLTDEDFFQGCDDYLQQARAVCTLPILRKDFIIDPWQVYETRALGADAMLLICAILNDQQLHELYELGNSIGLDCLIEVHDNTEMQRALALQPPLIGINNRNLRTFATDLQTSVSLAAQIPKDSDCLLVSESGIHNRDDVRMLAGHGINTFLVGESLMRQADPGKALDQLLHGE